MKRFCFLVFTLICCFIPLATKADVVWPALYVWLGGTTPVVIIIGLLTEILVIKYFIKNSWLKASIIGILMNLLTAAIGLGIFHVTYFGLFVDTWAIRLTGGEHRLEFWTCMAAWYCIFVLINSLVEWLFVIVLLRKNFLKTLGWIFFANALSISYVFIYLFIYKDSIHL